jgi:hypothetical protein
MAACEHHAVLIVTTAVLDTSTTLARRRVELTCRLFAGHAGAHRDAQHDVEWQGAHGRTTTVLRHEDDPESD